MLYKEVKQTIQQRAEIMDDIYFRMYANDGVLFPFSSINMNNDGQAIYQYVFSTSTHSDGWNGPENIKLALQGAFLSTNIEPANNSYSINKRETYLSGFRFKVWGEPLDVLVERSITCISSTVLYRL